MLGLWREVIAATLAAGGDLMPEESDGGLPKLAFGDVKSEVALLHDLKNLPEMLEMAAAVEAAHQVVVGKWEAEW